MAAIIAIREGLYDARKSRSPFAWTILTNANERAGRLREGINATSKILLLGLAIDTIYQIIVFKTFYPYEALIIAVLLAFLPYLLIRRLALRIARKYHPNRDGANAAPKRVSLLVLTPAAGVLDLREDCVEIERWLFLCGGYLRSFRFVGPRGPASRTANMRAE